MHVQSKLMFVVACHRQQQITDQESSDCIGKQGLCWRFMHAVYIVRPFGEAYQHTYQIHTIQSVCTADEWFLQVRTVFFIDLCLQPTVYGSEEHKHLCIRSWGSFHICMAGFCRRILNFVIMSKPHVYPTKNELRQ